MILLRLSESLSRGLVLLISVCLAATVSFFGVRTGLAQLAADRGTERDLKWATRLEPQNPEYWYVLGRSQQFNLEQPDPSSAVASFQRATELDPHYADAWLDLATTYELENNGKGAQEAYLQAKESYPASAEVSWRYGNYLLRADQLPAAYVELRRAVEADPRRAAAAFSRVYRVNPDLDAILERLLPPSQAVYTGVIHEAISAGELAVAQTVWNRLLRLQPRLQVRDFTELVNTLIEKGEYDAARRVWEQGSAAMDLPPLLRPGGSVVWDPSFESGLDEHAFAWFFDPLVQGVRIRVDTSEKLSGTQSLRFSFDGRHNPGQELACTNTVVDPGVTYLFSGWIKTREITTDSGLAFRLRPYGAALHPAVNTKEIHGTNGWTLVDQTVAADRDVHMVQVCICRDASDNPDVRISGDAWVDDVNLVPQPERRRP